MRAPVVILALATFASAPLLAQSRGGPSQPPPAVSDAHAFQAPAGSPLVTRNGRPVWEVYSDCAWANFTAYKAHIAEESQRAAREKAAEAQSGAAPGSLASLASTNTAARKAQAAEAMQKGQRLSARSDALTARAVTAYAAMVSKPESEVKAYASNAPAVATLTVAACEGLQP